MTKLDERRNGGWRFRALVLFAACWIALTAPALALDTGSLPLASKTTISSTVTTSPTTEPSGASAGTTVQTTSGSILSATPIWCDTALWSNTAGWSDAIVSCTIVSDTALWSDTLTESEF